ncbi:MAG: trypsin-like peptidase domain-containing protein [Oligosphaeraceae bacterium]
MFYYVQSRGKVLGPYTSGQIKDLMLQGHFDASLQVSADRRIWVSPQEVAEFREWVLRHPLPAAPSSSEGKTTNPLHLGLFGAKLQKGMKIKLLLGSVALLLLFFGFLASQGSPEDPAIFTGEGKGDDWPCYEKVKSAIALVVMVVENREEGEMAEFPIGTAFAVSPDTFVTNAHVAEGFTTSHFAWSVVANDLAQEAERQNMSMEEFLGGVDWDGVEAFVREFSQVCRVVRVELRMNGTGEVFPVSRVMVHPNYIDEEQKGLYDVAKMTIRGRVATYFQVANKQELHALHEGQSIASAGFPTEGTGLNLDVNHPVASFADGKIRRMTNFGGADGGKENNRLIDHSIPAAGGASGSPIFDRKGHVVAVLWGVAFAGRLNGERIASGSLNNFSVRIDQTEAILPQDMMPLEQWVRK